MWSLQHSLETYADATTLIKMLEKATFRELKVDGHELYCYEMVHRIGGEVRARQGHGSESCLKLKIGIGLLWNLVYVSQNSEKSL